MFYTIFNPIEDEIFRGYSRMGDGWGKNLLFKTCNTYPTMIKRGTIISYLKI